MIAFWDSFCSDYPLCHPDNADVCAFSEIIKNTVDLASEVRKSLSKEQLELMPDWLSDAEV